jgi:hypothetical protein
MEVVSMSSAHRANINVHELFEFYNVAKEEQDENDPRNVQVPETEGEQEDEGPYLDSSTYTQPIKKWKVNIGATENPKFPQIGYY